MPRQLVSGTSLAQADKLHITRVTVLEQGADEMKKYAVHPLARLAVVLVTVCAAVLQLPGVAMAHDVLTRTSPANGATVETSPANVEFEFDAEVKPSFATVVVTGPDGQRWDTGEAAVDGLVVRAAVKSSAPAGAYTAAYRVVSSDSHPITGSIKYTVKTATPQVVQVAPSTAAPAMPAGNAQPSAPPNDESASPA